jgi:hypothetical protein
MPNNHNEKTTKQSALWPWLPLLILITIAAAMRSKLPPWAFMWALAAAIFYGLKWLTWWHARNKVPHSKSRSLAYLLAWPGMDAATFLSNNHPPPPTSRQWIWAATKTITGILLLWLGARQAPQNLPLLRGWLGLLALILILHFGTFELIALAWQALGVNAQPIMQSPAFSHSLSEFWGKRWNLGFRQLSYDLLFNPLHRKIGVAAATMLVFLFSGLIHESVISLPARGGYGLPTAYFLLQGAGVLLERSPIGRALALQRGVTGWTFMAIFTAGPAFWLFHPPFIERVALPFMHAIRAL